MNRVLITGITGKSGRYMLKEMVAHATELIGYHFKLFVRSTTDTSEIDEASKVFSIEKFVGDKKNPPDVEKFCGGGYDTLVHISSIRDSRLLVSTALSAGVRRLILVHTTGIYSKYKKAGEEYRQIDAEVERLCKEAGASLTILRPTMIYGDLRDGNLSTFIKMVDKLRLFPTVNGAKYDLQPVWCGDLGRAYYQVMMNPMTTENKNYDLSGGRPIMLIDMFKVIANQLGVRNKFIYVPFWIAYSGAWMIYILTIGKKDMREQVQRLVEPRAYSHEVATRDFEYTPLNFEDGIREEIKMYLDMKKVK